MSHDLVSSSPKAPQSRSTGKLVYLSWVSVFTTGAILLFHVVRGFDGIPGHQFENAEKIQLISIFSGHLHLWIMPMFFCIGGITAFLAARRRSPRAVLAERVKRLLIPYVACALTLAPFMEWAVRGLVRAEETRGFWAYLVESHFTERAVTFSPYTFWTFGNYLWFLGAFFVASVFVVPVAGWLFHWDATGASLRRLQGAQTWLANHRVALVGLFVAPGLVKYALQPIFPAYVDWADFLYWTTFLGLGFVALSSAEVMAQVAGMWKRVLAFHGACFLGFVFLMVEGSAVRYLSEPGYGVMDLLVVLACASVAWSLILTMMGLAHKRWTGRGALAARLQAQITLPFYILHFPIIMVVAAVILPLPLHVLSKIPLLALIGGVLTTGVVMLAVRTPGISFLLGVKRDSKVAKPATEVAVESSASDEKSVDEQSNPAA